VIAATDAVDLLRIFALIPHVEFWRRRRGPSSCVNHFRAQGQRSRWRSSDGRLRLRRLIRAVDARLPGGGNCYRRVLIEMALDPDSAAKPLHFGLIRSGGPGSGHAWLDGEAVSAGDYEVEFKI
jgi:hypothetical protein